jgi:PST family polysaccharide transporter
MTTSHVPDRAAADLQEPAGLIEDDRSLSPTDSVVAGTRWGTISQVLTQVLRLVTQVVLARILLPSAFGVITLGLTFIMFLDLFKDLGTVTTIIQRPVITQRLLSSLFIVNLVVGAAMSGLFALVAPLLVPADAGADAVRILQVLGASLAISAVALVHQGLIRRDRKFGQLAGITVGQAAAAAIVSIALALAGLGAWSLVWGTLASSLVAVVMSWRASRFRPRWEFCWSDVKDVSGFSLQITSFNMFNYLFLNADKVIVGRVLGATALGLYALGQRVLMYPVRSVTQMLQQVLLPTFARMAENSAISRGYLRASSGIAMLTFPSMTGITLLAGPLVTTVFGPRWNDAIPVIAILAPMGLLHSLHFTVGAIYAAKGAGRLLLIWGMVSGLLTLLGYVAGLPWGIVGVAVGYAIVVVLLTYPTFAIPFRLIDLKVIELWKAVWPYTWMTAIMAVAVGAIRVALELRDASDPAVLLGCGSLGTVVYLLLLWWRRPPALADLRLVLRRAR